MGINPLWPDLQ